MEIILTAMHRNHINSYNIIEQLCMEIILTAMHEEHSRHVHKLGILCGCTQVKANEYAIFSTTTEHPIQSYKSVFWFFNLKSLPMSAFYHSMENQHISSKRPPTHLPKKICTGRAQKRGRNAQQERYRGSCVPLCLLLKIP